MVNVHKIAYAIDYDEKIYNVFPMWRDDSLARLTDEKTGESFKIMLGDLFEDYTLLDHNRVVIHKATGEAD